MDIKKIKKLITLVETSDISSLCVEEDQLKIEIKKESPNQVIQTTAAALPIEKPTPIAQESVKTETPNTPSNLKEIKSPMVGTFYASPNPESSPFVSVGSSIKDGQIVCIIEAMKLFNEIESEVSGKIEKVCVNNGDAIEFGQTLFLVSQS